MIVAEHDKPLTLGGRGYQKVDRAGRAVSSSLGQQLLDFAGPLEDTIVHCDAAKEIVQQTLLLEPVG
jgi:hypothetical protein